jgi:membrane protease YdiL (CAAX protease family)
MAASQSPGTESGDRAGDTTFYFAVAIGITWLALLVPSLAALGVIEGAPASYMAGAPIAIFGPAIAAILAARREGGRPAVRAMLRGLRAWRVGPLWYVLALTLPGLVYAAGRAVYALVPGGEDAPWVGLPERPEHFAAMLLVPIGEEIGWRGFALPRLLARFGAWRATAILGAFWALWHLPMFLSTGSNASQVVEQMVFIALGNVMFTWFFLRTRGSLLLAVLLHVGAHLDSPTRALTTSSTPLHILTLAYLGVAIALVVFDRRTFAITLPAPATEA